MLRKARHSGQLALPKSSYLLSISLRILKKQRLQRSSCKTSGLLLGEVGHNRVVFHPATVLTTSNEDESMLKNSVESIQSFTRTRRMAMGQGEGQQTLQVRVCGTWATGGKLLQMKLCWSVSGNGKEAVLSDAEHLAGFMFCIICVCF
jgi:hypothetical protein